MLYPRWLSAPRFDVVSAVAGRILLCCFAVAVRRPPFFAHLLIAATCCAVGFPAKYIKNLISGAYFEYYYVTAQGKAAERDEHLVFTREGKLSSSTQRGCMDLTLSEPDWHVGANAVLEAAMTHCGPERVESIRKHHRNVGDYSVDFGWAAARDYDIENRKKVEINPSHDLGAANGALMNLISARHNAKLAKRTADIAALPAVPAVPAAKRPRFPAAHHPQAVHRAGPSAGTHCFRCGKLGHFPNDCRSTTTVTGRPVAGFAAGARSNNALADAAGTPYCLMYARASQCGRAGCRYLHSCSICGAEHGAGECTRVA